MVYSFISSTDFIYEVIVHAAEKFPTKDLEDVDI